MVQPDPVLARSPLFFSMQLHRANWRNLDPEARAIGATLSFVGAIEFLDALLLPLIVDPSMMVSSFASMTRAPGAERHSYTAVICHARGYRL